MAKKLVVLKGGALELEQISEELRSVTPEQADEILQEVIFFSRESVKESIALIIMMKVLKSKMKRYLRKV